MSIPLVIVGANAAAVYYAGASEPAPQEAQVIPALVLGYEYQWSAMYTSSTLIEGALRIDDEFAGDSRLQNQV